MPQKFEHYFESHGTVKADKNITIYPEVPGTIISVVAKEGKSVKRGEKLVILDTDVLQKQIEQTNTGYQLSKTVFERQSKLWDQKIGSEMQYLEAKANKESMEKSLEALRAQLSMAVVTAPFDGIVDEVFLNKGELANPAMPLLRLVNLSEVYIKSDVSENYIGKVKAGDFVEVSLPSLGMKVPTTVNRTGNFINPNNRTFTVRVDLENNEDLLKPNLLAVLAIRDFEQDSTVVIPSSLIQQDADGKDFVFKLVKGAESDMVEKVLLERGLSYKGTTHILSGLEGNEELIVKGARSVKDGDPVTVTTGS